MLDGFGADARRSGADLSVARTRLAGTAISPKADRFGLLGDLIGQHDEAQRQVLGALASLRDGFEQLDASACQFADAFRVASEVR